MYRVITYLTECDIQEDIVARGAVLQSRTQLRFSIMLHNDYWDDYDWELQKKLEAEFTDNGDRFNHRVIKTTPIELFMEKHAEKQRIIQETIKNENSD